MPISKYNDLFGGGRGAAQKALDSMKRTYGTKDGTHVFYAKVAKAKRKTKPGARRAK